MNIQRLLAWFGLSVVSVHWFFFLLLCLCKTIITVLSLLSRRKRLGVTSRWPFNWTNGTTVTWWCHSVHLTVDLPGVPQTQKALSRLEESTSWPTTKTLPVATTPPTPLLPVSQISLVAAVSGLAPSVCTCVFVRVIQGQQISGRVCWQAEEAWHKSTCSVGRVRTGTPLKQGASVQLLPERYYVGVCVGAWFRVWGSRWRWAAYLCVWEITGWLGRWVKQ